MSREKLDICTVACVEAMDFSNEVEEWFLDQDISTHYQNDVVQVEDDGNVFVKWLEQNGLCLEEQHHYNVYKEGDKGFSTWLL